ncbi:MAG: CRISPR-associated endonuclease Cas1 [Sulfuritalea sp.]|nr:CRISPR-associated endonuclease Cas1 [Sulfuritalea sp.]
MIETFQSELPLPFPELTGDMPLLPARMVNEYQYCPRLAYLEWVQGEWRDSADTVEGRFRHRRVDSPGGALPAPDAAAEGERIHARSVTLSSVRLGVIAKMDLVEGEGGGGAARVAPVDYKRGQRPHVAHGAYDPERVQLCIQGLLLEEHGYAVEDGVLYFAESRERVRVAFDAELRALTLNAIDGLRLVAAGGQIPPPLEDSPKCPRCSLAPICLPDEVNFFKHERTPPRPLAVGLDNALPMYVQTCRAKVAKDGERLVVSVEDVEVAHARLNEVSQLALFGNVYLTTPCLHELMSREIPVSWHSFGGWFLGHTIGTGHKNVELRTAQYRASFDPRFCLHLARGLVEAKIMNGRTLLRRNWRPEEKPEALLASMKEDAQAARRAATLPELLGIEGAAAARYFGAFANLVKSEHGAHGKGGEFSFDFSARNRRPPTDPVNALLSFAYSLLARTFTVTLAAVGFDAYRGYYHQPRYGRPALALDLMEPFRPLVADSSVIQAINNGEVRPSDFVRAGRAVALAPEGRKRFIAAFERRLSHEITHPVFDYQVSYRRVLEIQARLLGRHLLGEIPDYINLVTR